MQYIMAIRNRREIMSEAFYYAVNKTANKNSKR